MNIFVKQAIISDEARSFINRCDVGLLSYEINAIDYLVSSLKDKNIWDSIIALYPFVGRNSNFFKLNLKNNSYALNYSSTISATFNGISSISNSYANTGIQISTLPRYNISSGVYRTNLGAANSGLSADFGSSYTPTGDTNRFYMGKDSSDTTNFNGCIALGAIGNSFTSQGSLTGLGLKMFSCENLSATGFKCWNNGVNTYTASGNQTWQQAGTIQLLTLNSNSVYTAKQTLGLYFLSAGLTPESCIYFNKIIQTFQQMLERNFIS